LYFPPEPSYSAVKDFSVIKTIKQNKYISQLAKDEDIFVRFMPKKDDKSAHTLIIDVIDLKNKFTKNSLWFSSRLYASSEVCNVSFIEFLNKIEKPLKPAKTFFCAFFQMMFHPNQKYFNYRETTPFSEESNLPEYLNDELNEAEQIRYEYNSQYIEKISKKSDEKAKIIKMF
jgi:hypothetical protein